MRAVVQRVSNAQVTVGDDVAGKIGKGVFVLLGVAQNDSENDSSVLAEKISKLRILSDDADKMNFSALDKNAEVLVVSQFTLLGDTKKGNRPSFVKAAAPKGARKLYEHFVESLRSSGLKTQTGKFGEYMKIEAALDGPVTIILDTKAQ